MRTGAIVLLIVSAAAVFAVGCKGKPQPATTFVVRDAMFDEMWDVLVHTVELRYSLGSAKKDERVVESIWLPKRPEGGADAVTERRKIEVRVAPRYPIDDSRGDFVLEVVVRVQERKGPGIFRKTPSPWRDAERDVELESSIKEQLQAILR